MRRVLFLAGMSVAHANHVVHEKETKALTALLGVDAMYAPPPLAKINEALKQKLAQAKAETKQLARARHHSRDPWWSRSPWLPFDEVACTCVVA